MWEPLTETEKAFYNLLEEARALTERPGADTALLSASALLDVMAVSFRYDRCRELAGLVVKYTRHKTKERKL